MKEAIANFVQRNGLGRFTPKVVLFDMDGVLCDSMPNHAIAWVESLKSYGIAFTAEDAYLTEGARGIDTIRKYVLAQRGEKISEAEAQSMYDEKARIFATLPEARIMPGAIDVMRNIKASGLKIGVVTGSGQLPLIARISHDFGEFLTEDDIVTAYDVKKGKPDPEPYLQGMRKCGGFRPGEAIVVENAPLGVRAGHASGAFTIAVNTGPLPDESLLREGADVLFKSMSDLAENWKTLIESAASATL